jgi:hypothetical protein
MPGFVTAFFTQRLRVQERQLLASPGYLAHAARRRHRLQPPVPASKSSPGPVGFGILNDQFSSAGRSVSRRVPRSAFVVPRDGGASRLVRRRQGRLQSGVALTTPLGQWETSTSPPGAVAPRSGRAVQRSARSRMARLYAAVNARRLAFGRTSGSDLTALRGAPPGAGPIDPVLFTCLIIAEYLTALQ